ncbi:hypothetical protein W02_07480 [Nitrospira sp. KM1]|uniref:CotH kinase family protein n=1 Tax=Nitrospira sp. KM1 TaxID=1936990 RepID=UPI0013A72E50|nr:CotH kinase family protein [Nitrospira sp. KM1]BCA53608.1 hypothetical protein W02_07480 [Nitrospira sp. KM1]
MMLSALTRSRRFVRLHMPFVAFALVLAAGCSSGSGDQPAGSNPPSQSPTQTTTPTAAASALPVLAITTNSGAEITSKEDYEASRYTLTSETGQQLLNSTLGIRGRGNSTWEMAKKPYRLQLTTSTSLLGMPANRNWALLANYADITLTRNELAFELSRQVGMEYTPRSVQVELQLNGTYRGIYQLTEHIRIDPNRVNIPELDEGDTGPDVITGGYLIEIDVTKGEDYCYESPRTQIVFCLSDPDSLLEPGRESQRAYIEGYIKQTEDAIYSDQFADPTAGYAAYLDVDSAINFYLVSEVTKNLDSALYKSVYLFKKRNGKLTFGPVWDFDMSSGNATFSDAGLPEGWWTRNGAWFVRMFQDPAFDARVKARWRQLKAAGVLDGIFTFIDNRTTYLSSVQSKNFDRWPIDAYTDVWWRNPVAISPYEDEVAAMKAWLRSRVNWMDTQLGS